MARSRRAAVLASAVLVAIHGCADESVYLAVPDAVFPTSGGGAGAPAEVLGEAGGAAGANDGLGTGGGRTRGGDGATTGPVVGSPVDPGAAGAGQAGQAGQAGAGGAAPTVALEGQPCEGYTLIGSPENDAGADFSAFLVDMDGNEVHRWTITGFPPKMLPGGSLIGCRGVFTTSYDCVEMVQVSWDGEREWSFDDWADLENGQTAARQHHDFQREGNPVGYYAPGREFVADGHTLVLAHHATVAPEIRDGELLDDVIYEVDYAGERTGFEWHGVDHIAEFGLDAAALDEIRNRSATVLEWLHGNSLSRLGPNRWYAAGHEEFHPNNIIYSSRVANLIVIISGSTGDVVWRIGPDFEGRPEESLGQFMGQHMPHMIPEGLPGAGNILVFDNGRGLGYGRPASSREWSRVVEFDPTTFEVVWQYGAASGEESFYSPIVSGAQRLPNGNTLITVGVSGHVIEVTPLGNVVWEYQYEAPSPELTRGFVYRAYRIAPEWLPPGENEAHGNYASWRSLFE